MKTFKLGGLVWQQTRDMLSYRSPWWIYLLWAAISLIVLGLEGAYVVSMVRNPPSYFLTRGRHKDSVEIVWKDETSAQRWEAGLALR